MTTHKIFKCPKCGETGGPARILLNATVRENLEFDEFGDGSIDVYAYETHVMEYLGQEIFECGNSECGYQTGDVNEFVVEVEDDE